MTALSEFYIKTETLKTMLQTLEKKGEKGISLTVSISDETNQYGQNVSAYVSQTKEQREAKISKFYVGNGKVFWTDGKIATAEKRQENSPVQYQPRPEDSSDELPF